MDNPLLDYYVEAMEHQADHSDMFHWEKKPMKHCMACSLEKEKYYYVENKWAWAVPDDGALELIKVYSPNGLVEIGAGTGYWANLLSQEIDVVAYDLNPPSVDSDVNHWHPNTEQFFPVAVGNSWSVLNHQDRTLFLCWPYMNEMAFDALKLYEGDTVVYLGEYEEGCCANDGFFLLLNTWEKMGEYQQPQWWGLHDWLTVWVR